MNFPKFSKRYKILRVFFVSYDANLIRHLSSCHYFCCHYFDLIHNAGFFRCDLAGSERLGKTMAEGVRLSEAKHINSSLLELG